MPQSCTVCQHPRRPEIDAALAAGSASTRLAALFQLSHDAVRRHRLAHLRAASSGVPGLREVLDQARALQALTLDTLRRARAEGDTRGVLLAVRAARANLDLLARLLSQLQAPGALDLARQPEWIALREAMAEALQPFPAASEAVAERLAALDTPPVGEDDPGEDAPGEDDAPEPHSAPPCPGAV